MNKINQAPAPRYFKTHANIRDLPRGKANIKIIYIARNPKDTVVSLYYHAKSKPEFKYKGDFNRFLSIFLENSAENGSWFDHVLDWYNECSKNPENHLFLKYEDVYDNTRDSILKIASFLNIYINDEILNSCLIGSSFDEMKVNSNIGFNHIRKGGYGKWREKFDKQTSIMFDNIYKEKMKNSDLIFNFGPDNNGDNVIL